MVEKLTEQEAAGYLIIETVKYVENSWSRLYQGLTMFYGEKFVIKNEKSAIFDLILALISQELVLIKTLYPREQSNRIEQWILELLSDAYNGDIQYIKNEIIQYQIALSKNEQTAIADRLFHHWLEDEIFNIASFYETGEIIELDLFLVSDYLKRFTGTWTNIVKELALVESDLPINYNTDGLENYIPGSIPDGSQGIYKVLVKGPWDGLKQIYMKLSVDEITKFVDGSNLAYAICSYEKSKAQYILVKKEPWDNFDRIIDKKIQSPAIKATSPSQIIDDNSIKNVMSTKNKKLGLYLILTPIVSLFIIFILFILSNILIGIMWEESNSESLLSIYTVVRFLLGFLGGVNIILIIPLIIIGFILRNKKELSPESPYDERSGKVNGDIPGEIQRWNWGAAGLSWIWGVYHGIYSSLWTILIIPIPFINIFLFIILGIKGNEWAWKAQRWSSVDNFLESQNKWNDWGILIFILFTLYNISFLY